MLPSPPNPAGNQPPVQATQPAAPTAPPYKWDKEEKLLSAAPVPPTNSSPTIEAPSLILPPFGSFMWPPASDRTLAFANFKDVAVPPAMTFSTTPPQDDYQAYLHAQQYHLNQQFDLMLNALQQCMRSNQTGIITSATALLQEFLREHSTAATSSAESASATSSKAAAMEGYLQQARDMLKGKFKPTADSKKIARLDTSATATSFVHPTPNSWNASLSASAGAASAGSSNAYAAMSEEQLRQEQVNLKMRISNAEASGYTSQMLSQPELLAPGVENVLFEATNISFAEYKRMNDDLKRLEDLLNLRAQTKPQAATKQQLAATQQELEWITSMGDLLEYAFQSGDAKVVAAASNVAHKFMATYRQQNSSLPPMPLHSGSPTIATFPGAIPRGLFHLSNRLLNQLPNSAHADLTAAPSATAATALSVRAPVTSSLTAAAPSASAASPDNTVKSPPKQNALSPTAATLSLRLLAPPRTHAKRKANDSPPSAQPSADKKLHTSGTAVAPANSETSQLAPNSSRSQ